MASEQSANKPQARFHQLPGSSPETHIDTPPLDVRHREQFRRQPYEIDEPFAKRPMCAGFIAMQRAIGIDQVNGANAPLQLVEKLLHSADQDVARTVLPRADHGTHISM